MLLEHLGNHRPIVVLPVVLLGVDGLLEVSAVPIFPLVGENEDEGPATEVPTGYFAPATVDAVDERSDELSSSSEPVVRCTQVRYVRLLYPSHVFLHFL